MIDLKPYLDAARAADEDVQKILKEMDTSFNSGSDEGKLKALEMRPKLDEAKKKAKEANDLYISMRDSSLAPSDLGKEFVPVTSNVIPEASAGKVMDRDAFLNLDAKSQMAFIQDGGKVVDPE